MTIFEQVNADLMAAMKSKEEPRLSTLRMLKAELQKLRAEKGRDAEISDEDAMAAVRRLIKQRVDAAEQYRTGGAEERAAEELAEAETLKPYLPAQLDDSEIEAVISAAAAEVGASTQKDMGKLMKAVMAKTSGRADGKRVKELVTAFLNR